MLDNMDLGKILVKLCGNHLGLEWLRVDLQLETRFTGFPEKLCLSHPWKFSRAGFAQGL